MFVVGRRAGFFLVLMLAALSLLAFAGCKDEAKPEVVQELVPPPAVPADHNLGNTRVVVNLEAVESTVDIAPGVSYTTWTFNGTVPGPMIRARVGDTVQVRLKNASTNLMPHDIDLHAVNGPGGGAGVTTVLPGEERVFEFKALSAGLYMYHCAQGIVADHIGNGMYGGILIEPAGGLREVDHEFYVGQSEFYTTGDLGATGHQDQDMDKMMSENPTYVVFNGNTKALIGDKALQAKVGDRVRLLVVNGGPNLSSSFHVIGEIFDRAWQDGAVGSPPREGVQTIAIPPGSAAIVEFKVDVPGDYKLVDHAVIRISKGAVGTLHVTGPEDPSIFKSLSGVTGAAATGHDMGTMTPAATATPATPAATATATKPAATAAPADANKVVMKDNLFEPKELTAKVGDTITYSVPNEGKVPHNMRIADAKGSYESKESVVTSPEIITAGKTGTLTFKPTAAGIYKFECELHPEQMTGTITVQP